MKTKILSITASFILLCFYPVTLFGLLVGEKVNSGIMDIGYLSFDLNNFIDDFEIKTPIPYLDALEVKNNIEGFLEGGVKLYYKEAKERKLSRGQTYELEIPRETVRLGPVTNFDLEVKDGLLKATVRILLKPYEWFSPEKQKQLIEKFSSMESIIEEAWSNKYKIALEDGEEERLLNVVLDIEFISKEEAERLPPNYIVFLGTGETMMSWHGEMDWIDVVHEVGHLIGNDDEYNEVLGQRVVPDSIMYMGFHVYPRHYKNFIEWLNQKTGNDWEIIESQNVKVGSLRNELPPVVKSVDDFNKLVDYFNWMKDKIVEKYGSNLLPELQKVLPDSVSKFPEGTSEIEIDYSPLFQTMSLYFYQQREASFIGMDHQLIGAIHIAFNEGVPTYIKNELNAEPSFLVLDWDSVVRTQKLIPPDKDLVFNNLIQEDPNFALGLSEVSSYNELRDFLNTLAEKISISYGVPIEDVKSVLSMPILTEDGYEYFLAQSHHSYPLSKIKIYNLSKKSIKIEFDDTPGFSESSIIINYENGKIISIERNFGGLFAPYHVYNRLLKVSQV